MTFERFLELRMEYEKFINQKPEDKPEEKPEDKPEEKPEDKPEEKPEDKPEEKPEEKPEDKPRESDEVKELRARVAALEKMTKAFQNVSPKGIEDVVKAMDLR